MIDAGLVPIEPTGELLISDHDLMDGLAQGHSEPNVLKGASTYTNQELEILNHPFDFRHHVRWRFITPKITTID